MDELKEHGDLLDFFAGREHKEPEIAQAAIKELAGRELCRRNLLPFIMKSDPNYLPGWVHKDICRRLEKFAQDVADKKSPRLMITMPPRSGKSTIVSKIYPAWHLGQYPDHEIIACSYSGALANDFSRKVRNLMREPMYNSVFNTRLDPDTQAVSYWATTNGGGFVPAGVSGAITGRGAHVALIDDPVKNREEAESEVTREAVWDWYTSTLYTRLAPGGGLLVVQCMTGDTPVLMADGKTKPLVDLVVGDAVATFDKGHLSTSTVLNHTSSGRDVVFKITTSSGRTVRANKRHPFLIQTASGGLEWVRTKNLRSGLKIVTLKDSGVSGKERYAKPTDAKNLLVAEDFVPPITTNGNGLQDTNHRRNSRDHAADSAQNSNTGTVLRSTSTKRSLRNKAAFALSAKRLLKNLIILTTGRILSALTTATTLARSGGCCATHATSSSAPETLPEYLPALPNISDFTVEEIVSITSDGVEEVFDVQIDRTENFIANGVVSHNTRWHHDDLAGRLLAEMDNGGEEWDLVEYPAIATEDEQYRKKGEALHPERYPLEALERIKRTVGPRDWQALYQQKPTADEGDYFTHQMIRFYKPQDLPERDALRFYTAWDLAVGTKQTNDWSVGVTVGVDNKDNIWLVDLFRARVDSKDLVDEIIDGWELWRQDIIGLEEGVIKHSIGPFFDKRIQERRATSLNYSPLKVGKSDKSARARSIQGMMKQGRVFIPEGASFTPDLINELLQFPNGKHDDQVDALAHIGQMLADMDSPGGEPAKKKKSWRDLLKRKAKKRGAMAA
ncbi:hypothetical protein GCM10023116_01690 [Kistimonas scapharcae]|uniref:Terminase large subunit n=1 Tax=Kistimonas scapharcae TaxID=1036133 RepID=A0ABP8UWC0_9GAMM